MEDNYNFDDYTKNGGEDGFFDIFPIPPSEFCGHL
jgi:hypothetical protein